MKPVDLMRHFVQLVTPPPTDGRRSLILDPFMGSGTTGMAAAGLGLDFIGIDLDPAHVQIARARIEWAAPGRRVDKPFGVLAPPHRDCDRLARS